MLLKAFNRLFEASPEGQKSTVQKSIESILLNSVGVYLTSYVAQIALKNNNSIAKSIFGARTPDGSLSSSQWLLVGIFGILATQVIKKVLFKKTNKFEIRDVPKNTPDTLCEFDSKKAPYWTCDHKAEHKILFAKSGPASKKSCAPNVLMNLLEACADNPNSKDKIALAIERLPNSCRTPAAVSKGSAPALLWNDWTKFTWKEYYQACETAAKGFTQYMNSKPPN